MGVSKKTTWEKTPNGNYQTRTTVNGNVYLSAPVTYAFALKLGMKPEKPEAKQ